MKTLSSEAIHQHSQQVSWLTDHRLADAFSHFRAMTYSAALLPIYSDRIAQDFHLIPFYPYRLRARKALRTLYSFS